MKIDSDSPRNWSRDEHGFFAKVMMRNLRIRAVLSARRGGRAGDNGEFGGVRDALRSGRRGMVGKQTCQPAR